MLPFPNQHKEITQQLLNGKFILQGDDLYNIIYQLKDMYKDFFAKTFDYEMVLTSEYVYLKSTNEKDRNTRDFLIFLALLCRELDKNGKDFKAEIESGAFHIDEVYSILNDSSKKREIIDNTSLVNNKKEIDLQNFLNEWNRRNLLSYTNNIKTNFRFTKAVHLFFDYATASEKLKETAN